MRERDVPGPNYPNDPAIRTRNRAAQATAGANVVVNQPSGAARINLQSTHQMTTRVTAAAPTYQFNFSISVTSNGPLPRSLVLPLNLGAQ